MQIRNASLRDCPGIARTQVDSYRCAYAGQFPQSYLEQFTYGEQQQDWIELLTCGGDDILLVAISPEEQVAGYVLAKSKLDIFPGFDSEIVALHVRQPFQGQGVGRALLGHAIGRLKIRDCKSVMLWTLKNNPVRVWYEKLGGRLLGEKNYEVEAWVINELAYGWDDISMLEERLQLNDAESQQFHHRKKGVAI